ncbi:hypothetical protein HRbin01_01357 [archaeon HR01]|nr:hypothetical protein HRbin01_01357 [archaeon HR01]
MTSLEELGFLRGCICEVIVSTYGSDGLPHAAPMGASTDDGERLVLRPFTTTQTYRNIVGRGFAVANISSDPLLFYKALSGEPLEFTRAETVEAPVVKGVDGWLELEAVGPVEERDGRARIVFTVRKMVALEVLPRAYSRAVHALMESMIHSTRVRVFYGTERHGEAVKLLEKMADYRALVDRVAAGTAYSQLMEKLYRDVLGWISSLEGKG